MKKIFGAALMLLMMHVNAAAVYSSNTHAVARVDSALTNTIVFIPWTGYTKMNTQDLDLRADRLVRPTNMEEGDVMYVLDMASYVPAESGWWYDNCDTYAAWILQKNVNETGMHWESAPTLTRHTVSSKPDLSVKRGYAIWVCRKNPLDAAGKPKPFYVYGQWAKGSQKITLAGGTTKLPGFTMLAHPVPGTEVELNSLKWDWSKVGEEDTIIIADMDSVQHRYCFRMKTRRSGVANQWCWCKMEGATSTYVTEIKIPPNTGFWYVRRVQDSMEFEWED